MDTRSKKIEINHSLFQQNRLSALNIFFISYSKAVALWKHISIYKVVSREYDTIEMDDLTIPTLIELDSSLFELRIFFDESEYKKFKELVKNIWKIHKRLVDLYLEYESVTSQNKKANSFELFKTQVFEDNENILNDLTKSLKDIFKT